MSKSGMSLIEAMAYLLVSITLIHNAGTLSFTIAKTIQTYTATNECLLQLAIALRHLAHDIHTAHNCLRGFHSKLLTKESCIFRLEEKDVGWVIKNNRLIRYAGHYNQTSNTWTHKSISTLVFSLNSFSLDYSYHNNQLQGIECKLCKNVQGKKLILTLFICIKGYT